MMLELVIMIVCLVIGIAVGRYIVLNTMIKEKEDKRVQFRGKMYRFDIKEDEIKAKVYTIKK